MKSLLFIISTFIITNVYGGTLTPMHIVEKSAYQLAGLVKQGKIDSSYLTNVDTLSIEVTSQGYTIHLTSPSDQKNKFNELSLAFAANGKLLQVDDKFVSAGPDKTFTTTDSSTLIDLTAEAFVDHLTEDPNNPIVAENVNNIIMAPVAGGINVQITLIDSRIYVLEMDTLGQITHKYFK